MTDLKRSWLVQRLQKPLGGGQMAALADAFSFGGGLKNGGLSDEAMDLIRDVFRFDYMGAAEFEFGAVPKALQQIARQQGDLEAGSIEIPLAEVAPPFLERKKESPLGAATVFWLAPSAWSDEVAERIRAWASEGYRSHLKEPHHLERSLRPADEWDRHTCGWLELDNGFLFFTDREMWEKACTLFGVDTTAAVV